MKNNNELLDTAKLTSKGQITIPKQIRDLLNLEQGDSVVFYVDENKNIKIANKKDCTVLPDENSKQVVVTIFSSLTSLRYKYSVLRNEFSSFNALGNASLLTLGLAIRSTNENSIVFARSRTFLLNGNVVSSILTVPMI